MRLSRFEGAPGSGPGISIEARGRFFGSGFTRRSTFFGIRSWGFGFGFIRLELVASLCSRFRFAWCCFFGITTSSYTESSSSESSSSLKQSRSTRSSFFHLLHDHDMFDPQKHDHKVCVENTFEKYDNEHYRGRQG